MFENQKKIRDSETFDKYYAGLIITVPLRNIICSLNPHVIIILTAQTEIKVTEEQPFNHLFQTH